MPERLLDISEAERTTIIDILTRRMLKIVIISTVITALAVASLIGIGIAVITKQNTLSSIQSNTVSITQHNCTDILRTKNVLIDIVGRETLGTFKVNKQQREYFVTQKQDTLKRLETINCRA